MGAGENLVLEQEEHYLTDGLITYVRVNGVNT